MSVVNISVNTETRESTLVVDGELVPATACHFVKGVDFDGVPFLRLSYVIESKNDNGLVERKEFFLPDPLDDATIANNHGFASRDFLSESSLAEDLSNYFGHNNEK